MSNEIPDGATATAEARPNIALVKYWGKRDIVLNLPVVGSLSITLDQLWTRTSVRFDATLAGDEFVLGGKRDEGQSRRATRCLDLLRERGGLSGYAYIESQNNFPTGAGLASSASGFAALVAAASAALALPLTATEQSEVARRCSGSAARSIFGGFVEWVHGSRDDGSDSVARPLSDARDWPLSVVIAITSRAEKAVGSTEGMNRTAQTSPFQAAWIAGQESDLAEAHAAIRDRDFGALAAISEHSCLKMHALAMAARPGLVYWNSATVEGIHRVRAMRARGIPVFFTIDAGPQLKAVCEPSAAEVVSAALRDIPGVLEVIKTGLGEGARVLSSNAAVMA